MKLNEMQIFENAEFGRITVIEKDGEPWFIGKEIADILGYAKTEKMTRRLDDDEKADAPFWSTSSGQHRKQTIINESGLYEAIFGSHKPNAKAFKKWIKTEVLPAIRKTGTYTAPKSYRAATKKLPSRAKIASDLQANLKIAQIFGLKGNQALLSANKMTSEYYSDYGVNPLVESGVKLINKEKTQFFTPSQIGNQINTTARKINKVLIDVGYQVAVRDHKKRISYNVTTSGRDYSQMIDSGKKHSDGSPVTQIKWSMGILPVVEPFIFS